jgi:hypothetical protein
MEREATVSGRHVMGQIGVHDHAPELVLPAVAVAVDEPRDQDHAPHVDADRLAVTGRGAEIATDRLDRRALDQHVALRQVFDFRIKADDDGAAQQHTAPRVGSGQPITDGGPFGVGNFVVSTGRGSGLAHVPLLYEARFRPVVF